MATLETDLHGSPEEPFLNIVKPYIWNNLYAQQYENEIRGQEKKYLDKIFAKYYLER